MPPDLTQENNFRIAPVAVLMFPCFVLFPCGRLGAQYKTVLRSVLLSNFYGTDGSGGGGGGGAWNAVVNGSKIHAVP